jgi:hypothetical protein
MNYEWLGGRWYGPVTHSYFNSAFGLGKVATQELVAGKVARQRICAMYVGCGAQRKSPYLAKFRTHGTRTWFRGLLFI